MTDLSNERQKSDSGVCRSLTASPHTLSPGDMAEPQEPVCVRLPFSAWLQHSPHWLRQVDENVLTVALSPHFPPPLSHYLCVVQMEEVIARMQDEKNGIPIRTVKSFLTKIPSVFSGKSFILVMLLSLPSPSPSSSPPTKCPPSYYSVLGKQNTESI